MRFGCGDEFEDFERVGVFCAGGGEAEEVTKWEFDFGGVEAELAIDFDTEVVGGLADGDS